MRYRTLAIAAVLGIVSVYAWSWFVFLFSSNLLTPYYQWSWPVGLIKSGFVRYSFSLVECTLCAVIFAVVLRIATGRRWIWPAVTFCIAFLSLFYLPIILDDEFDAIVVVTYPSLVALLSVTVLLFAGFAKLPRQRDA